MRTKIFSLLLAGLLAGCSDTLNDLDRIGQSTLNPRISFPLMNSTFGIEDFVTNNDSLVGIGTDPDGVITLYYRTEDLFSQSAESYIEIPDEVYSEELTFSVPQLGPLPIEGSVSKTESYNFTLQPEDGDQLDSVFLRSGSLSLALQADFPASGQVKFVFKSLFENGLPIERTYNWQYTGQQPAFDLAEVIDLGAFKMDLTDGGTSFNSFDFDVEITLIYEGQPVGPTNRLTIDLELLDGEFDSVFGFLAERSISAEADTIDLGFFDNIESGNLFLSNPRINFYVGNSFGIPISATVNNFVARNEQESIALTGSITQPQVINAPTLAELGDTVETIISINNTNSNIAEVLDIFPQEIIYDFSGTINPGAAATKSFALAESILEIDAEVELPLEGRLSSLRAVRDYDFDVSDEIDELNSLLFQISTVNEFPLAMDLQVYFLDGAGNVIDAIVEGDDKVLEAAPVDQNGFATGTTESVVTVEMNKDRLENIRDARFIRLETVFSTTNDGTVNVKILDSYRVTMKLGTSAVLEVKL